MKELRRGKFEGYIIAIYDLEDQTKPERYVLSFWKDVEDRYTFAWKSSFMTYEGALQGSYNLARAFMGETL